MKSKITQALVERGPTPERGKSVLHADTEMRGFYLIVTPTKRSFYVQSLVNGPDGHPNSPAYGHLKLPHMN